MPPDMIDLGSVKYFQSHERGSTSDRYMVTAPGNLA